MARAPRRSPSNAASDPRDIGARCRTAPPCPPSANTSGSSPSPRRWRGHRCSSYLRRVCRRRLPCLGSRPLETGPVPCPRIPSSNITDPLPRTILRSRALRSNNGSCVRSSPSHAMRSNATKCGGWRRNSRLRKFARPSASRQTTSPSRTALRHRTAFTSRSQRRPRLERVPVAGDERAAALLDERERPEAIELDFPSHVRIRQRLRHAEQAHGGHPSCPHPGVSSQNPIQLRSCGCSTIHDSCC